MPDGVDPSRPHSARVYDYLLGGKDHYEVDRVVGDRMLAVAPDTRTLAWFSRQFLVGAVGMAAAAGVRQFIDFGTGIPTSPNVHETAHAVDPSARVAYIDYDPVVHIHCDALLTGSPGVAVLLGDLRRPDEVFDQLETGALIDFDAPVLVSIVGVLHYVMDHEHPFDILARIRDRIAPGSYLAITHGATDTDSEFTTAMTTATDNTPAQVILRTPQQIATFSDGLDVIDPGWAPLQQWLGDDLPPTRLVIYGGIAHKPHNRPADHPTHPRHTAATGIGSSCLRRRETVDTGRQIRRHARTR